MENMNRYQLAGLPGRRPPGTPECCDLHVLRLSTAVPPRAFGRLPSSPGRGWLAEHYVGNQI